MSVLVLVLTLLGLIGFVVPLTHEDRGTRGTGELKVDGTQTNIAVLLSLKQSLELELEEANEEYAACQYDSIAWPDVQYAEGQLEGFKRVLAALDITLPAGET